VIAAGVALALLVSALRGPGAAALPCPMSGPCGAPPTAPALINGATWTSRDLGFGFVYDAGRWQVEEQSGRFVRMRNRRSGALLVVEGEPAASASPAALFSRRLGIVQKALLGVIADPRPGTRIFGPEIGFRDGIGGSYVGAFDTALGTTEYQQVAIMAAGDTRTSVAETVIVDGTDPKARQRAMEAADSVVNATQFPASAGGG
jgi:hypothetical protein